MNKDNTIEIRIFGLQNHGNDDVRADVFAKKLSELIEALKAADSQSNGKKNFDYFISVYQMGNVVKGMVINRLDYMNLIADTGLCSEARG